jgi:hypothetical protein
MKKEISLINKGHVLRRVHLFFIWAVRFIFIIVLIIGVWRENWENVALISFALILTYLAVFIERRWKIDIPIEFEIGIVILILGSIFFGEVQGFYILFPWWDLFLHGFTGAMVGLLGFIILLVMYEKKKVEASPIVIALFSFSLAAAIGSVWEIFEFAMDQIFGLNMQKSGLMDTMWDIIVNNVGALIASGIGYGYLKLKLREI